MVKIVKIIKPDSLVCLRCAAKLNAQADLKNKEIKLTPFKCHICSKNFYGMMFENYKKDADGEN